MSLANLPQGKRCQQLSRKRPAKQVRRLAGEALEARHLLANLDRTFLPDNSEPDDQPQFGYRVAASATQYAVSAPGATIQGQVRGEAFLYDAAGSLVRTFLSSTGATHFGSGLALEGNYMLVGDDALGVGRGSVSLYDVITGLPTSLSHPVVQAGDRFGAAVALRGNVMAVGAPGVTVSAQVGAGVVHLYDPASPSTTRRTINNPDSATGDAFGSAVAVDGNVALVGAPNDDNGGTDAGRAYLFDVTTGQLLRTLNAPTAAAEDLFGASVALLNDNVVIGAPRRDFSGNANVGQTFVMSAATGAVVATINNPSADANDEFGAAVAVSSAGIVVGAPLDDTRTNNSGLAQLFDAGGAFTHTLANPTDVTNDRFGAALVIAGDYYIVGMPGDDSHFRNSGKVRAYSVASGALIREFFSPAPGLNDNFGAALAVAGNRLAVGAPSEAGGSASGGAVYVFDFTTGSLVRTIANPTPEVGDLFGGRLDWEGDKLVVSAMSDNSPNPDSGSVYLFDSETGGLLQTITNPDFANDQFGASVAISGNRLAVGMQIGVNEGKAFVFNADTGVRTLTIADPQPAPQSRFGFALDLDGDKLVVGAPSAANEGKAFAFNATTGSLLSVLPPVLTGLAYRFGNAVAISGNRVLIGDNPNAAGTFSNAHLFSLGTYTVLDSFPLPAAGAGLGETAVAISGSQLGIASTDATAIVTMPGAGYLYNRKTLTAALTTGSLVIDTTGVSDVADNNIRVVRAGNDLLLTNTGEFFTSAPSVGSLENQGSTLRIPFAAITGSLTIRTNAGNDSLTVDWSGGDVLPAGGLSYQGGTQTNTLSIVGGPQGDVTYSQSSTTAGMVEFADFGMLSYTGLSSLLNSGQVTNATIKLRSGVATLQDDGTFSSGNGLSKVVLSTMVNLVFASPSNTLNIVPNGNNNGILCYSLPDLTSNLIIGTDTDRVGSLTIGGLQLASDRSLTAYSTSTITVESGLALRTSGTGNMSLITSRAINIFGPTSTVDGNLLLSANQQPVSANGSGASVYVHTGTVVEATGTGNVTVLGRGRTSVSDNNHGVYLYGAGTQLRAATGSVTVNGQGGGSGLAATNYGVVVEAGATIQGGSLGGLTVDGSGGGSTSTTGGNHGVFVTGSGSQLTSGGGNVIVRGTSGLTSTLGSAGVMVFGFGAISAGIAGNVTVEGRGSTLAAATAGGYRGVVVDSGTITAQSNNVVVRGWGGGVGSGSGNNVGVLIRDSNAASPGRIFAASTASVTVEGIGGNAMTPSGSNNQGVYVEDAGSGISAGVVSVTGTGGGGSNSTGNTGVTVADAASIASPGALTLIGNGGGGTSSHGVEVQGAGSYIQSTLSLARLTGTSRPAAGNAGITVHSGGLLGGATSLGSLELATDTLQLAGPISVQLAATQTATIRPFTLGLPIHLGGDDVPGTALGLSSSELNSISGPALLIGNASSGDVVLVDQVTRTVAGNVSLTAGANRTLDLGANSFIVPVASQVSFNTSGSGSLATGDRLGTDVTAAQLNLTAGSAFGVRVGSDTLFDQLSVAGLVKLGGAGLLPALHLRPYGTYLPVGGGTLLIVQNDGTDPIDGRFVAGVGSSQAAGTVLTEGMVVSDNLFGTGLTATISYLGGSGNDIVLLLADQPRESAVAREINNQLIVTGTTASDSIIVSSVGPQVRVRVGGRVLGQFVRPQGIVIDGLSGDDYVYVAPQLPATIVTTEDVPLVAAHDAIYASDNTEVEPLAPPPAGYDQSVRDAALLSLLGNWIADYGQLFPGGSTNQSVRRR